jgi:alanyl-tRNA synthetase
MADTVKLYYEDPYLKKNGAVVIKTLEFKRAGENGAETSQCEIITDKTCFYPEGGGQISDRGTINGLAVDSVYEQKDENGCAVIVHRLCGPCTVKPGDAVSCEIDFAARFQNMQDHTAQHILSESFIRTADLHTISMHMGPEYMTIDLLVTEKHGKISEKNFKLDRAILDNAENLANSIVHQNLNVRSRLIDKTELAGVCLRKTPELADEKVRLVSAEGFDNSLCCGTHLASTGEAGIIKIIGQQKANNAVRIRFVSGMKALNDYRRKNYVLSEAAEYLSVENSELMRSIEKISAENKSLARKKNELFDNFYAKTAGELGEGKYLENGIYWLEPDDLEYGELARIGQIFSKAAGSFGFALIANDASGFFRFIIGRTQNYPRDAKKAFAEIAAAFGVKGGGSPMVAQGGTIERTRAGEFKNLVKAVFSI